MAMKMKNCPKCGRIFVPLNPTQKYCADCMEKERQLENELSRYVRDHPKIKIDELIEATGAPEKVVRKMIREGRFIQLGVQMTYPCERCGAPITQGKLCPKCAAALQKDLQGAAQDIARKKAEGKYEAQPTFRIERDSQKKGRGQGMRYK